MIGSQRMCLRHGSVGVMSKILTKKAVYRTLAVAGAITALSFMPVYAEYSGAVLSGVEINPSNDNSYQIVVKTNKNVPIQEHVTANDKIEIDLKNIKPANFVNTVYKNATNIDHVIVQPDADDQVKILLQGQNISSSEITLDTTAKDLSNQNLSPVISTGTSDSQTASQTAVQNTISSNSSTSVQQQNQQPETVVLSRPIESYKPVAMYDNYNDNSQQASEEQPINEVQNSITAGSIKKIFKKAVLKWLLGFMMVCMAAFSIINFFKTRKKSINISLSADTRQRELDLHQIFSSRRELSGLGLGSKKFEESLAKPGYNSFSRYGLKEYQNSQLPKSVPNLPRQSSGIAPVRNEHKVAPARNGSLLKAPVMPKPSARTQNSGRIMHNETRAAKTSLDGIKFLENMAKIYEKSGRIDLARGLQAKILRAQGS